MMHSTKHGARSQRGLTLLEVTVVVAISSVMTMVAYQILEGSYRTALMMESRNELLLLSQRPTQAIQTAVYQAETVFDDDPAGIGDGYYARFIAELANKPISETALPVAYPSADMSQAAASPTGKVGNCLLIARQLPPIMILYDHDSNAGTAKVPFPVDRYRFELFYVRKDTNQAFWISKTTDPSKTHGWYTLDLMRARTIDFADYFQLNPLIGTGGVFTAAQKTQIVAGMVAANLNRLWDPSPGLLVNQAFYTMNGSGTFAANSGAALTIPSDGGIKSLIPQIYSAGITGSIHYSLSYPFSLTWQNQQNSFRNQTQQALVPFGTSPEPVVDPGYRVTIAGAGAGQRVEVRVEMMARHAAPGARGRFDYMQGFVVTARGLSI